MIRALLALVLLSAAPNPWPPEPMRNLIGNWSCTFGSQSRSVTITRVMIYPNAPQLRETDTINGGAPFEEVLYTNPNGNAGSETWTYSTPETFNVAAFSGQSPNEGSAQNVAGQTVRFNLLNPHQGIAGFQQVVTFPNGGFKRVWRVQKNSGGRWLVVRTDSCTPA